MNLKTLKELFVKAGCVKLYAKPLSPNDNSKNQVYLAGSVEALNIFPSRQILSKNTKQGPSFRAHLDFGWLLDTGKVSSAPNAQLILYAQYPEVRFSGFLMGCAEAPSMVMASRQEGRILFLGVNQSDRRLLGYVVGGDSTIATEFRSLRGETALGVFTCLDLPQVLGDEEARKKLLAQLHRINNKGWIDSKQLDSHGKIEPCNTSQCGGFTLEAEFGIPKNSSVEPDYLGWEIKQHAVSNFERYEAGTITLMTPEPTGGYYKTNGVEAFVRHFGYADKRGRPDRINFGGIHKAGVRHPLTKLEMVLRGYDTSRNRITDAEGSIALMSTKNVVAAEWSFSGILSHWSRKHNKAVFVPSLVRHEPSIQYRYGNKVRLTMGTNGLHLLAAMAAGTVYYDPGIKLEKASEDKPVTKRRSQFRIASRNIRCLYSSLELVEL